MFTIAYAARSRSGWSDEKGDLFDCVMINSLDRDALESICVDLNNRFGRSFRVTDDYLEYYVEEISNVD